MSELIQRNVVIFPTGLVRQRASDLSQMIAELVPCEFVLNDNDALQHVSVLQSCYPADAEQSLLAAVGQIAAETSSQAVAMDGYGIFWDTLVFWDTQISSRLLALHERLVGVLNPLRQGNILEIHRGMLRDPTVAESLKESIRLAGNPLALNTFRPHITLTRCRDVAGVAQAQRDILDAHPSSPELSFLVTSLAVTEVGPHGTCPRIIAQFPLGGTLT